MPLFFFDVTDGEFQPDLVGVELAGTASARVHAVNLCGRLLKSNQAKFWKGEDWLIEVKDDIGLALFTLVFMARDSPVTRSDRARPSTSVL